jgi:2,4-dienoyl-CoA reductase-like NADH-dependent reductase (Old Yellow Enzyme family)
MVLVSGLILEEAYPFPIFVQQRVNFNQLKHSRQANFGIWPVLMCWIGCRSPQRCVGVQPSMEIASSLRLPCGVTIPNRLCKSAMTEALADEWGRPTDRLCRLYDRWSAGGAGLLITGNIQIDRRYVERPGNVCIDGIQDEVQLELLKAFAKSGQSHGSLIFAQLGHAGRQSNGMINMNPVSPGSVRLDLPQAFFGTPTPLSVEDIQDIKERFIYAATVCKSCGFDGVQIHSAHGYLLSSFLNPRANNRPDLFENDQYGGPLENRVRLLLEIVRGIRKEVGSDYPISVKLNSADFQEGGFSPEEAVQVAVLLDQEGIDLLEISGGNYESGIYEDTVTKQERDKGLRDSTKRREAYFLSYAIEVKNAMHKTPTLVTGGWRSRENMDTAIKDRECSLIGLGRPLCGDPDGPKKLFSGEIDSLPRFEKNLRTFHWSLQWIFLLPVRLVHLVDMVSQQSWYYRQIVSIADTGEPDPSLGCFASYLANMSHEQELARNIKGNVNCVGSVYKGPQAGP